MDIQRNPHFPFAEWIFMKKRAVEGISFWEFDLLKNRPEIAHGSFLRHGGESKGDFESLNVSFTQGDDPQNVERNRNKIQEILHLKALAAVNQCHGKESVVIKSGKEPVNPADALITESKKIGLLIQHADCQACLLYDPVREIIANIHAGWRGSIQKIYTATIERLQREFGSNPENLLACISPSLGPEESEFLNYREELPESFWNYQVRPSYFDFWAISKDELIRAGVLPHHIEIAEISTFKHPEDYFSYRRQKRTGRLATVIGFV